MFSSKQYIKMMFILFVVFVVFHSVVWIFFTSQIFGRIDNKYVGDLGRTGYQLDSLYPRKQEYNLKKRHIGKQNFHNQKIDIMTLGDSFFNADTGGLNPYFQDYLATCYDLNILNLRREPLGYYNSYKLVLYLYNSGWLKKHKPKYILIQTVGRFVYKRYSQKFDFTFSEKPKYIVEKTKVYDSYIPPLLWINTANYKFVKAYIDFLYKNQYRGVLRFNLNKKLFSPKKFQNKLLVTDEDIVDGIHNESSYTELININFNKLAKLLKNINVKLIFMPIVDKYDLYGKYIIDNRYPKNLFFENMRKLKKDYIFIDTKQILQDYIDKYNEKDVFYPDDTHWSYKASDILSKDKVFNFLKK
jgi:hypothetical protein